MHGPEQTDTQQIMARQQEPLELYGHRIVPIATHQGSVRQWRCLDCRSEADDAESYLDTDCEME